MSGSLESLRWDVCVHRLDLGLYSHPKEFRWNGTRTHVSSKGKNPLYRKKFSSEEDRTHDAASSRTVSPAHHQRATPTPTPPPLPLLFLYVYVDCHFFVLLVASIMFVKVSSILFHSTLCWSLRAFHFFVYLFSGSLGEFI